jgi:hypothetical protein
MLLAFFTSALYVSSAPNGSKGYKAGLGSVARRKISAPRDKNAEHSQFLCLYAINAWKYACMDVGVCVCQRILRCTLLGKFQ